METLRGRILESHIDLVPLISRLRPLPKDTQLFPVNSKGVEMSLQIANVFLSKLVKRRLSQIFEALELERRERSSIAALARPLV